MFKYRFPLCRAALALALVFPTGSVIADAPPLAELERRLLTHPALLALGADSRALAERAESAAALPDPELALGINNVPISDPAFDRFLPSNKTVSIQQRIPNSAERDARGADWRRQSAARQLALRATTVRLVATLHEALIEQRALRLELELSDALLNAYDELEAALTRDLKAGRVRYHDVSRAEIGRLDVRRSQSDLRAQLDSVQAELIALVGEAPVTVPETPALSVWSGDDMTWWRVRLERADLAVADARIALAESAFRPDWGVRLSYHQREAGNTPGATFAGDDWFSAQLTFSVPLWSRSNQKPGLRAAREARSAASQRTEAAAREARAQWLALQARWQSASERLAHLLEQRAAVERQRQSLLADYESGIGAYSTVLEATLATLNIDRAIARAGVQRDRAALQANALWEAS